MNWNMMNDDDILWIFIWLLNYMNYDCVFMWSWLMILFDIYMWYEV